MFWIPLQGLLKEIQKTSFLLVTENTYQCIASVQAFQVKRAKLRILFTYIFLFSLGPKLNTKIGLLTTTTTHKELLDQQYLSCYWPNFDETLKVGSWEHQEQIPTFVQAIFVLATFVHVGNISAVTDPMLIKL